MSSGTLTSTSDDVRLKPDATGGDAHEGRLKPDPTGDKRGEGRGSRLQPDSSATVDSGIQPWQFFVLAALGCATAVTFLVRGQGVTVVILVSALMAATALVGMAALRAVRPLVGPQDDRTVVIGERTRATLERDKTLTLRAIKDLEFDRAMGKLSEEDFREMGGRLRARAARLIKQLDVGAGYRDQIERDLMKRLGQGGEKATAQEARACAGCGTGNDRDAKFCKQCGGRL
jgi:hypothetical protein